MCCPTKSRNRHLLTACGRTENPAHGQIMLPHSITKYHPTSYTIKIPSYYKHSSLIVPYSTYLSVCLSCLPVCLTDWPPRWSWHLVCWRMWSRWTTRLWDSRWTGSLVAPRMETVPLKNCSLSPREWCVAASLRHVGLQQCVTIPTPTCLPSRVGGQVMSEVQTREVVRWWVKCRLERWSGDEWGAD